MAGRQEPRRAPRKPVRLHDSGFASDDDYGDYSSDSSDSAVGSSPPVRPLALPTLRQTNWDFGTPRSRYARDELQLMQPEGFPIIPLASTLARAREEAEAEAVVREYSGPDFAIYEDTIEEHDALPEIVVPDTTDNKVIDSRGRTRAASKRLGLDAATAPNDASSEEKENTTQAGKKRKRGGAQAGKQPRKQAKKVTQDAETA